MEKFYCFYFVPYLCGGCLARLLVVFDHDDLMVSNSPHVKIPALGPFAGVNDVSSNFCTALEREPPSGICNVKKTPLKRR